MNHVVLIRSLLRVVGVLLVGLNVPGLVDYAMAIGNGLLSRILSGAGFDVPTVWMFATWVAVRGSGAAIGLYLLFGGRRVLRWYLRGDPGCCPRCEYPLGAGLSDACPKCGMETGKPVESV